MTFHLAAVDAPAHFQRSSNHSSRKRRPPTPLGDGSVHPSVFASRIRAPKRTPTNHRRTIVRTENCLNENAANPRQPYCGHAGAIDATSRKPIARGFTTAGKVERGLQIDGSEK
jgi:hypothetical protein